MSIEVATKSERESIEPEVSTGQTRRRGRQIGTRPGLSMLARGEPMLWITGGSLVLAVLMILGLLLLVIFAGMSTFWPLALVQINTLDGKTYLGEITRQEHYDLKYDRIASLSDQQVPAALDMLNPLLHQEIQRRLDSGRMEAELASIREPLSDAIMRDVALNSQVRNAPRSVRNKVTRTVETALKTQAEDFAARLEQELAEAVAADTTGTAIYALWTELKAVEPVWVAPSTEEESTASWDTEQWSLDQAWKRKALELLTRDVKIPMRRRLFRTENFELTGTHFHWISDYEITSNEDRPKWALTIERLAGGRFYGTPEQFVLRSLRTIPAVEQKLHSIVHFFQANQWRLDEEPDQQTLAAVIAEVNQEYVTTRKKNVRHFLSRWKPNDDRLLQAVDQQGNYFLLAEATPDQAIVEMQEVWVDAASAWEQYTHWHEPVRERYAEQVRIDEVDRGRIGDRINDARLGLRRAELDFEVLVEDQAREMYQLNLELAALEESQQKTVDLVIQIREYLGEDAAGTVLAERFLALLQEENRQQATKPKQRKAELQDQVDETPEEAKAAVASYLEVRRQANLDDAEFAQKVELLKQENSRYQMRMITAQEQPAVIPLNEIVRAYPANRLDGTGKLAIYGGRWREFLMDKPREANSEGGVFPAIWGTIAMTLIMSLVVVPFGVLAALYLREYAKSGPIVSAVRISINNLAGVPSIVFGVFGLGFFCYMVGAYVDGGPENAKLPVWPAARWFVALAILSVVALAAFVLSLFSLGARRSAATGLKRYVGYAAVITWLLATGLVVVVVGTTPYFNGWFETNLPNPKFGQGGMLWSSLTLALLTLPVVIVATEEALSAVPNSLREGSYACGAGKWQTIRRIVLPHAMPGIMTGMILAMARGAGEVAPLMLVGAAKMAPNLPVDTVFPFIHADRSFMHLGFHIYDLGFQSQNSEAAKPMVFTTTLLLIVIIAVLNLAAVGLRARLKKRFFSSAF